MGGTRAKSKASLKTQLADYSQEACAQLERTGIAAGIKKWVSYSAAAASALASVTSADAGVIYSGIRNIVSGPSVDGYGSPGNVDIDGDGKIEFQVIGYETGRYGVGKIRAPLSTAGVNAIFVSLLSGDAVRFPAGQSLGTISSKGSFKRLVVLGAKAQSVGKNYGNFQNSTMGFAGFRFNPGDGDRYGWIRLHLDDGGSDKNGLTDMVTAVDWAYESRINTPIRIGDTGASVPEPSSLTLMGLAMGCAALPALRRRRKLRDTAASQARESFVVNT